MKFSTIENIQDLKPGDRVVYMDDIHKRKERLLHVIEVKEETIECKRHIIEFNDFECILKLED